LESDPALPLCPNEEFEGDELLVDNESSGRPSIELLEGEEEDDELELARDGIAELDEDDELAEVDPAGRLVPSDDWLVVDDAELTDVNPPGRFMLETGWLFADDAELADVNPPGRFTAEAGWPVAPALETLPEVLVEPLGGCEPLRPSACCP
jgi:hypothetical protein